MAVTYDIKWKNDLKMYMNTFKSFILEGNVNDLQPIDGADGMEYVSLNEAIAEMYGDDFCVVFYDHTKQSGKEISADAAAGDNGGNAPAVDEDLGESLEKADDIDDTWFNSFTFYKKTVFSSSGAKITSPNIELFKEYYKEDYVKRVSEVSKKDMQGGSTIDIRRIFDVMNEFDEKKKDPKYAEAKPFLFLLAGVSRYMTTPGSPRDKENAILMILFNATQIDRTSCKLVLSVDKINDLPAWFESESNNSAVKKIFIPMPDGKFRETFYHLEMTKIMDPISESETDTKVKKFSAYTENYSLRRLQQLKSFIDKEADNVEANVPSLRRIENIDKTVLRFDSGQSKDPWRDEGLKKRIEELPANVRKEIKGQDGSVVKVAKALKTAAVGGKGVKKNDRRPRAIFFFAGPTGVGKTELTKQLAENIFQKEDSMIRFDMSEFKDDHTDARLFGAPPGYVGYEAGGELTKAVKQNPFSIILFDEIEKASSRIWDKFLQILGDGRLTDGKGETVSFTQSIIVFTSNLGITADPVGIEGKSQRNVAIEVNASKIEDALKDIRDKNYVGGDGNPKSAEVKLSRKDLVDKLIELYEEQARLKGLTVDIMNDDFFKECYGDFGAFDTQGAFEAFVEICVKNRIKAYFEGIGRREVLGRIGDNSIMVFNFIAPDVAKQIIESKIEKYIKHYKTDAEVRIDLTITDEAKKFIIKKATDPEILNLGGRGISDCVDNLLSDLISEFIFDNGGKPSATIDAGFDSLKVV